MDLEAASHNFVHIIYGGSVQVLDRHFVYNELDPMLLEDMIGLPNIPLQSHTILKARTPSACHIHTQGIALQVPFLKEILDSRCGGGSQGYLISLGLLYQRHCSLHFYGSKSIIVAQFGKIVSAFSVDVNNHVINPNQILTEMNRHSIIKCHESIAGSSDAGD